MTKEEIADRKERTAVLFSRAFDTYDRALINEGFISFDNPRAQCLFSWASVYTALCEAERQMK